MIVKARMADGAEVTIEQDYEVPSFVIQPMKIDPEWTWTDPAGHLHDADLSSAVWKVTRTYWCDDCRDVHEDSALVCRFCGCEVKPERVPDPDALKPIAGLKRGKVEVRRDGVRSIYHLPAALMGNIVVDADGALNAAWLAAAENDEYLLERWAE